MNRPDKRARHLARMRLCDFKRMDGAEVFRLGTAATQAELDASRYIDPRPEPHAKHRGHVGLINRAGESSTESCEVPSHDNSAWMFFRIGPFETTGGNTWSRALVVFPEHVFSRWDGGRVFIGDHIVGNANASGDLVPYPPLHQHHFHLFHGSNMWRQSLNAHGDSECARGQRVYCMLKEYPEGLAFHVRQRLGLWSDFNDVRTAGSRVLQSYVFAGVRLLRPGTRPRPIRHSYMMVHPFVGSILDRDVRDGVAPPFGYWRGEEGRFATFTVNTTMETVMWSTGVLPDVDTVLDAYFHTHREMVDDFWFFEAPPSELGLLEAPWADAFCAYRSAPRGTELVEALKAHLARHEAAKTRLLCKYSALQTYSRDRSAEGDLARGRPAGSKVACPFPRTVTGDVRWTAVLFSRRQPGGESLAPSYSMHAVVRVYHTTRRDADLDRDPAWHMGSQGGPTDCDIVREPHRINFGKSCGEEIYQPFDAAMLVWYPLWHPALRARLLSLATSERVQAAAEVLLGPHLFETPSGRLLLPLLSTTTGSAHAGGVALGAALVLLCVVVGCCCCCCRRLRSSAPTRIQRDYDPKPLLTSC